MLTGGLLGKGMRALGYDPEATHGFLDTLYSDARKLEDRLYEEAEGFTETLGVLAKNPRTLAGNIFRTLPLMLNTIGAGRIFAARAAAGAEKAALARGFSETAAKAVAKAAAVRAG